MTWHIGPTVPEAAGLGRPGMGVVVLFLGQGLGGSLSRMERRTQMAKPTKGKKEKLGVKIVVELTGHMPRTEVDQFMAALTSVVNNHLENGGNGGE
jgi:hypothetical protein